MLSYAELTALVGRPFTAGAGTELVLEHLSTPWASNGRVSYSLLLTGPVDQELALGDYRLQDGEVTLALCLEPVARDIRFVHYEACVCESVAAEDLALAG
ncbi:MAG: DUF6916 family protein [Nocardioides sp.]